MSLDEYQRKRNFTQTPEPRNNGRMDKKHIFVVQKHQASHLHYDFRLEFEGVLKSWAIPKGPPLDPKEKHLAVMTEDHPLDYANFEGTIPKGNYGAGKVEIWDHGTYKASEFHRGLREGGISFVLNGKKLKGQFTLVKLKGRDDKSWFMMKSKDSEEADIDLSKATKGQMPHKVKPMLATLIKEPFDDKNWIYEIKWDGYRSIAEVENGQVELYSRNFISFNDRYSPVAESLKNLNHAAVLDGEIVVIDDSGKSNFQLLQNYQSTKSGNLVYNVFDLLYIDGYDIRAIPLIKRKEILKQVLPALSHVKYSDHVEEKGKEFFKKAVELGIEGIMAKNSQGPYREGMRSNEWLKIKAEDRQEAVIAGFTKPQGSRKYFGSLVLGLYEDGMLRYVGHTGTGFTYKVLKDLYSKLKPLSQENSPFEHSPKTNMPVTWVKPKMVAEIHFRGWTNEGIMRQPSFMGLREDKAATEVVKETPAAAKTMSREKHKNFFTNLNKIYWPEEDYTKNDLIEYYDSVAAYILPHLKDRPLTLHRYPDGITGADFYQKDFPYKLPRWVKTVQIDLLTEKKRVKTIVCQNRETLLYLANLGSIELHPWSSRINNLMKPDFCVIDLDPEDVPFSMVAETALTVKHILDKSGAISFCKTSGARGMHIYVPIGAQYTYEQARQFAEVIAGLAHERIPQITSIERTPGKRLKKVYLDYLQNNYAQTMAAPYSVRARAGATVATPLRWDEVDKKLDPRAFTIRTIGKRLKKTGDIWKRILTEKTDLRECLIRLERK